MTSATVAKTAKTGVQAQAKPEKIRRDHKVNWWLTAVCDGVEPYRARAVVFRCGHRVEDAGRGWHVQLADHVGMA